MIVVEKQVILAIQTNFPVAVIATFWLRVARNEVVYEGKLVIDMIIIVQST